MSLGWPVFYFWRHEELMKSKYRHHICHNIWTFRNIDTFEGIGWGLVTICSIKELKHVIPIHGQNSNTTLLPVYKKLYISLPHTHTHTKLITWYLYIYLTYQAIKFLIFVMYHATHLHNLEPQYIFYWTVFFCFFFIFHDTCGISRY